MARPIIFPRFASTVAAAVVEPISSKKDVGWLEGEEPPAPLFNWLHKITHEWISFFAAALPNEVTHPISHFTFVSIGGVGTLTAPKWAHGAAITLNVPLAPLKIGDQIVSASARLNGMGVAGWAVHLEKLELATRTITTIVTQPAAGTGDETITAVAPTPEVVTAGYTYHLRCVSSASGGEAYGGAVTCKRDPL